MVRALVIAVIAGCASPHAWRSSDVALEATFIAATAVDWGQSGKYSAGCREANPVIGACGDRVPLAVWMPIAMLAHLAITHALPAGTWRTAWLGVTAGLEVDSVYANYLLDTATR